MVTPASKKSLLPDVIRRIGRLEIRARYIVEGLLSGMHRSPYFGQSIEFREHREYSIGDDLRHIDWKVWGKQDRLYVKRYEEDTNLRCTLVVDGSASMHYGSDAMTKQDYAATAAAAFAYLLLKQSDSVGCVVFDEAIRHEVPMRNQRNHLARIARALEQVEPRDKTDIDAVLAHVAKTNPRKGMIVLISDLLCNTDQLISGLGTLRRIGHDVVVLHVMDDNELDFTFRGPVRFENMEGEEIIDCNPRALRKGYMEALERFLTKVRKSCTSNAVDYSLIRTSDPLDAALMSILTRRTLSQRSKI
ncbi:hypothetical protein Pan181_22660 [Aeoliella mucimassa]|uniref:VWFA domain-containing protein n=1 Tax=Aeoliella mucimassa TaxID=2527972 RepID=A0A518AMW9_9BACT|nr:hypothetical protein Pan181_22660 [Aeoliella mucimassa]